MPKGLILQPGKSCFHTSPGTPCSQRHSEHSDSTVLSMDPLARAETFLLFLSLYLATSATNASKQSFRGTLCWCVCSTLGGGVEDHWGWCLLLQCCVLAQTPVLADWYKRAFIRKGSFRVAPERAKRKTALSTGGICPSVRVSGMEAVYAVTLRLPPDINSSLSETCPQPAKRLHPSLPAGASVAML